mgnify:CR=1 FL=1
MSFLLLTIVTPALRCKDIQITTEIEMQDQINKAFKELNAQMLERQMAWAMAAKDALTNFDAAEDEDLEFAKGKWGERSEEYRHRVMERKIEICGGKKWWEQMYGGNKQMLAEFVAKNIAGIIESRDSRIIAALNKAGITEIPEFTLTHSSNGYEGIFNVAGHTVSIQTIIAGGYNIQCLHQRTLIKVKAAA